MTTIYCKSEFTERYRTFWGKIIYGWLTTYTDPGTGRETSFRGRVMQPKILTLGGVRVKAIPTK